MAEVFDESTRLDLARGAYGGFWRFRDKGAFTTRPDGGDLRKWSTFWPDKFKPRDIDACVAEAYMDAKRAGRLDELGFTGAGGGLPVRGWLTVDNQIINAYPCFPPDAHDTGTPGTIVRSVSMDAGHFLHVEVAEGSELLGLYLSLDFPGPKLSPFLDVIDLARRGVTEGPVGGENTDSFHVEVTGNRTVLALHYRDEATLEIATEEFVRALEEWASWVD